MAGSKNAKNNPTRTTVSRDAKTKICENRLSFLKPESIDISYLEAKKKVYIESKFKNKNEDLHMFI